jgi:hypothetical protein
MQFGPEIMRGVRLAAILFAIGLIGLTVYRMLDVDDDDTTSASSTPAVAPLPAKAVKQSKAGDVYPPPPPPLPGRGVQAKPAAQGRDVVVVSVPPARDAFVADAATLPSSSDLASSSPAPVAVIAQPAAAPAPDAPVQHRSNRFVRTMRRILHIGK